MPTVRMMIPKAPKRILIVEDDPLTREVLCIVVSMDGHQVETAATIEEALFKCNDKIDIVLTGHIMSGMRGDELARTIKQRYPSMRIIMLAVFSPGRMPEEVSQVLIKPFNTEFLRRVLVEP